MQLDAPCRRKGSNASRRAPCLPSLQFLWHYTIALCTTWCALSLRDATLSVRLDGGGCAPRVMEAENADAAAAAAAAAAAPGSSIPRTLHLVDADMMELMRRWGSSDTQQAFEISRPRENVRSVLERARGMYQEAGWQVKMWGAPQLREMFASDELLQAIGRACTFDHSATSFGAELAVEHVGLLLLRHQGGGVVVGHRAEAIRALDALLDSLSPQNDFLAAFDYSTDPLKPLAPHLLITSVIGSTVQSNALSVALERHRIVAREMDAAREDRAVAMHGALFVGAAGRAVINSVTPTSALVGYRLLFELHGPAMRWRPAGVPVDEEEPYFRLRPSVCCFV